MQRVDLETCEPFRAWNRLEPRPRKSEFDRVLRVEIYDPLWMLTRQWQFGEFKGEDTGSAIFAKVKMETTKISKFQNENKDISSYNDSIPLETRVERLQFDMDFKTRSELGLQWLKILDAHGVLFNASSPAILYDKAVMKNIFVTTFPFQVPVIDNNSDNTALQIEKAKLLCNIEAVQYVNAIAGRIPDGYNVYKALKKTISSSSSLPDSINIQIHDSHTNFVLDAANEFIAWFNKIFNLPENESDSCWNHSQLEYQFACALPDKEGSDNTVLTANEYYHGQLDWYSFNIEPDPKGNIKSKGSESDTLVNTEILTVIPTEARFQGMPNSRWWEFEDGYMDFGNITAETTDIAKIILSEFALIYSNDWLIIPYTVPVGSFSEIKGILVTDVFGQITLVEPAGQGDTNDWMSWTMFNLTKNEHTSKELPRDNRLLMPPSIPKVLESEPIESVSFIRDEMANMVWGVETKLNNLIGVGKDGHTVAKSFAQYLKDIEKSSISNSIPTNTEEEALLKYKLSNTVPENWIPFIPVHIGQQNRAIQLQRASMPRWFNQEFSAVRPRTDIMRKGMNVDENMEVTVFVNTGTDIQDSPYYVNEEEVPRTGTIVKSTFQRARWYNGKIVNWFGRRKKVGRGEAGSGLQYDIITNKISEKDPLESNI